MKQPQRTDSTEAGANIEWRQFSGPLADEIFIQCRPDPGQESNIAYRVVAAYRSLDSFLRQRNASLENLVQEVVYFRDIRRDFEQFQRARLQALHPASRSLPCMPAAAFIEQPPLDAQLDWVTSAIAIIPHRGALEGRAFHSPADGRSYFLGEQKHLCAGGICGNPGDAFHQTYSMFCLAEEMLKKEEMSFQDVVRTWIYLRHMERDYAEFNRGRREFFRQRNIAQLPASTGINGSPFPEKADLTLSFCAIKSRRHLEASAMTTPTLNEARTYGADFSRGLRVVEGNKVALYISGTASVDEAGHTAHVNDLAGQVGRMLLNVETLLTAQNASFENVLSAVTYLKRPEDAPLLRRILHDRGLDDVPNALVQAAVCRPDLLCEMEAIAALPLPGAA